MKFKLVKSATFLVITGLSLLAASSASMATVPPSIGDVSQNSNVLTFNNYSPAITVTMTSSNVELHNGSDGFPMQATTNFWGGVGDSTGAYTPNAVHGHLGLGTLARSLTQSSCANIQGGATAEAGTVIDCSGPASITFTFSQAVTNPVLHVADLAGGADDSTFFSDYKLQTAGLKLKALSHIGNFEVHADKKSFGTIHAPGTGFAKRGYSAVDVLPTSGKENAFGSGYGSILIEGTLSTVTFDVTYKYFNFSSEDAVTPRNTVADNPEGVAFNFTIPSVSANPDTQTFKQGVTFNGSAVIAGNSSAVTYSVPTQPDCGTVTMQGDGSYSFDAKTASTHSCEFTYMICKNSDSGDCAFATITLATASAGNPDSLANTGVTMESMWIPALLILGGLLIWPTWIGIEKSLLRKRSR